MDGMATQQMNADCLHMTIEFKITDMNSKYIGKSKKGYTPASNTGHNKSVYFEDNRPKTAVQMQNAGVVNHMGQNAEVIQRVPLDANGLTFGHKQLLDEDELFDMATSNQSGISQLLHGIDREKEKRNSMNATEQESIEYVELERLRKKIDRKIKITIGAHGTVKEPASDKAKLNVYGKIFSMALMIPEMRSLETGKILHRLQDLYREYEAIPSLVKTLTAKLKVAEEISETALSLPDTFTFAGVKKALQKFPHVLLDEGQAISLNDLWGVVRQLGDESREVGLVDVSDKEKTKGALGVFYGPKQSSIATAGASVSAPTERITGFEGLSTSFLAHTHPRKTSRQKAHTGELQKDIETSTRRFELVRTASQKTLYYNKEGSVNTKVRGHKDMQFGDHLNMPTMAKSKIEWFYKLPEGEKFERAPPSASVIEHYKKMAKQEIDRIWKKIETIRRIINTRQLTREQYNFYLEEFTHLMEMLQKGELHSFDEFWKAHPKEPDPHYVKQEFDLFGDIGAMTFDSESSSDSDDGRGGN